MTDSLTSDDKLARYEQALRDIIDPIGAMRRDLPPGYSLNGQAAVRAAGNPQTYKDIARKALGDAA
jgi:hypothetical protein